MDILGNSEVLKYLFLALASGLSVCVFAYIFIPFGIKIQKRLDRKIEAMPSSFDEKEDHLIAEYDTYTTEDLLEKLKKIHFKGTSHNSAIFHVLSTRVNEEWFIPRIQELQGAINPLTRMNANYVMAHYYEKQYLEYANEKLLDLLQHLEDRNEQEIQALLHVSLSRIDDQRVRHCIHQLLYSKKRNNKFNTEHLIKEYFGRHDNDDTVDDLINLLNNMKGRNMQVISVLMSIAESRMKDQRVNLCIKQLQNSKNYLIRAQAKQIMKKYMT